MRAARAFIAIVILFLPPLVSAYAAGSDLDAWFMHATSYHSNTVYRLMAKPDFIGGSSLDTMVCGWNGNGAQPAGFLGVWQLLKYDRRHHIALAAASTDQCSAALFSAPYPHVAAPDADLSRVATGRGLHLGSSYADIVATYGGRAVEHPRHFVLGYAANNVVGHAVTIGHPRVLLPEDITIVLDDDRISSITIYVEEGGLF